MPNRLLGNLRIVLAVLCPFLDNGYPFSDSRGQKQFPTQAITPVFMLSSFQPVVVLKSAFSQGEKTARLRRVLVMVQFAVSIIMILCTLVVSKQFEFMKNKDTGFDKDQVVTLPMTDDMQRHFDAIREDLLTNPEIKGITASTRQLGTPLWRNQIFFEGKKPEDQWISP